MKIKKLRLDRPVTKFNSQDFFVDGEHDTKLGVMPWGSYVIKRKNEAVMVPATWGMAEIDLEEPAPEAEPEAPQAEQPEPQPKRGPGRPKKEPAAAE